MADIIGKRSGFNYSQRWGSQLGNTSPFELGARPVPEGDWNEMTDEEKLATMGTTDGHFLDQAHEAWQTRSKPGGDIYDERARAYEAISNSGAQDWTGIERALIQAGFDPSIHEQGSLFKQLSQIFKGVPIESRGAQQPQNQSARFRSGMQGIRDYLPGGKEEELMRSWHGQGANELIPIPGGGYRTSDWSEVYDRFGYQLDPTTGQRTGRHYMGFSELNSRKDYVPGRGVPKENLGPPVPNAPPGTPPGTPGAPGPNNPAVPTVMPGQSQQQQQQQQKSAWGLPADPYAANRNQVPTQPQQRTTPGERNYLADPSRQIRLEQGTAPPNSAPIMPSSRQRRTEKRNSAYGIYG